MKYRALLVVAVVIILIVLARINIASSPLVIDVSWPNCDQELSMHQSGIVGVNGGRNFSDNNCISSERSYFNNYSLYVNTGYPGRSYGLRYKDYPNKCINNLCLAYNYGYNAALHAISYADNSDAHSTNWWLDVELVNSWTNSVSENRQYLVGVVNAIKHNILFSQVGVYSSQLQWHLIMGNWNIHSPAWLGSDVTTSASAKQLCKLKSFTAEPYSYIQYLAKFDSDYPCQNFTNTQ